MRDVLKEVMLSSINLLVITSARHYKDGDSLFAYGPYVREIELWADLFASIVIAAPCRLGPPPGDYLPFSSKRISIHPVSEMGGETIGAKLKQIAMLPKLVVELCSVMYRAEAIHVRCPGNLGLLGVVLAPLFADRRIAKYAGEWGGYPREAWTIRLQRWLLRSRWWGAPVTVYGSHPKQPTHVVPFFTSVLDDLQMAQGRRAAECRSPLVGSHLHVLFVGRLAPSRNVDVLIGAIANLVDEGVILDCTIVGDGPEGPRLRRIAAASSAADHVHFVGAIAHDRVLRYYEQADVLVLASETEGWGKSIVEAMAFGLVCIGSDRGPVPDILSDGRGLIIVPRDLKALSKHLRNIANNPTGFMPMRTAAAHWGQRFTLSGLRDALRDLLETRWDSESQRIVMGDRTVSV
jgi:glycosyltransferase involved in cell wall biosynthesis